MNWVPIEGYAIAKSFLQFLPKTITQVAYSVHWRKIAGKLASLAEAYSH